MLFSLRTETGLEKKKLNLNQPYSSEQLTLCHTQSVAEGLGKFIHKQGCGITTICDSKFFCNSNLGCSGMTLNCIFRVISMSLIDL